MWKISKQVLEVAACTFMWLFVCPSVNWSVVLLHVWRGKCDGKRQRAWGIVHNERETKSLLNFVSCFQSRFATPNSKVRMRFMHWYKIGRLFLYHYTSWITLLVLLSKLNSLGEGWKGLGKAGGKFEVWKLKLEPFASHGLLLSTLCAPAASHFVQKPSRCLATPRGASSIREGFIPYAC